MSYLYIYIATVKSSIEQIPEEKKALPKAERAVTHTCMHTHARSRTHALSAHLESELSPPSTLASSPSGGKRAGELWTLHKRKALTFRARKLMPSHPRLFRYCQGSLLSDQGIQLHPPPQLASTEKAPEGARLTTCGEQKLCGAWPRGERGRKQGRWRMLSPDQCFWSGGWSMPRDRDAAPSKTSHVASRPGSIRSSGSTLG